MQAAISTTRACISSTANLLPAGTRNSLYFADKGHAGGLVFDFAKPEVQDFLIQNAKFFLDEYRVDGFRYDQVSVIDHDGAPHGWRFCQDLTATLHAHRAGALNHAEYWSVNPYVVKAVPEGAGFDTTLTDGLRMAIRDVIANASGPDERPLNMTSLARSLWPEGFQEQWRFVQGPENHDIVYNGREHAHRPSRGSGESPFLVRPQPCPCGDRAQSHRAGHSHAVHGAGISGGQAMVGRF